MKASVSSKLFAASRITFGHKYKLAMVEVVFKSMISDALWLLLNCIKDQTNA